MPEIVIREIDNTSAGLSNLNEFVVFVPGNLGKNGDEKYVGERTLFKSYADFIKAIGDEAFEYTDKLDPFGKVDCGYTFAKFLLSKGLYVLYSIPKSTTGTELGYKEVELTEDTYQPNTYYIYTTITSYTNVTSEVTSENFSTYLANGLYTESEGTYTRLPDGTSYDDTATYYVQNSTQGYVLDSSLTFDDGKTYYEKDITYAYQTYSGIATAINNSDFYVDLDDKSLYDIRFITTGGYVNGYVDAQNKNVSQTALTTIKTIAETRGDCVALIDHKYDETNVTNIITIAQGYSSTFTTMFTPWCYYGDNLFPSSIAYLEAFANGVINNPNWYAMAGATRGNISGTPYIEYGENKAKSLTDPNGNDTGVSVNPITTINPYGILIWGNRTLFNNPTGLVASSFLNIRQLCCDLKKQLYISAKGCMFEQNSDRLWFKFKSIIVKLLDNMKSGEGVRGYKIIKLTPDTKAQIKCLIKVDPIEAVEKFDITVELTDTDVTVE